MPEYIDREAALSELNKICEYFDSKDTQYGVTFSMDEIRQLPSVDVKQLRHGRWEQSDIPSELFKCSVCGGGAWYYDYYGDVIKSRYCPNCGAKMDSE